MYVPKKNCALNLNNNLVWYIENGYLPSISNEIPTGLEACDWNTISQLIKKGTFGSHYKVGDTKTFKLTTGEEVTMVVAKINTGTGLAAEYYPNNTVDFISKDCVTLTSPTMKGYGTNGFNKGWLGSAIRENLNHVDLYPLLPQVLKNLIIEKKHMYMVNTSSLEVAYDKLWLPTLFEVSGQTSVSGNGYNEQYPIFTNDASRIKKIGKTGSPTLWPLADHYLAYSRSWLAVMSNGTAPYQESLWGTEQVNYPVCFRLG